MGRTIKRRHIEAAFCSLEDLRWIEIRNDNLARTSYPVALSILVAS